MGHFFQSLYIDTPKDSALKLFSILTPLWLVVLAIPSISNETNMRVLVILMLPHFIS